MNTFWVSNVKYGNYSEQYCIVNLKVAKRDLKCPHHKKKRKW